MANVGDKVVVGLSTGKYVLGMVVGKPIQTWAGNGHKVLSQAVVSGRTIEFYNINNISRAK